MRVSDIRIGWRLLAVVATGVIGLAVFAAVSLTNLHASLVAEREATAKEHAEVARSLITGIAADWKRAGRPDAEAKQAAMDALRAVRYAGSNYFWINDMSGVMLMHPAKPALDGTSVLPIKSASGSPIFADMIDVVRKAGGGFYRYTWQNAGETEPREKISYVAGIRDWDWVVGTGAYIDDIDATFRRSALRLGVVGAAVLLAGCGVSLLVSLPSP